MSEATFELAPQLYRFGDAEVTSRCNGPHAVATRCLLVHRFEEPLDDSDLGFTLYRMCERLAPERSPRAPAASKHNADD